jgi:uncharacterized protein with FMN-binding domain
VRTVTAVGTAAASAIVLLASWQAGQRSGGQAHGIRVLSGAQGGAPSAGTPAPSHSTGRQARPHGHATSAAGSRTVTGALVQTQYGNVQVRVTLRGNRLTDVRAVHLTDSSSTSVQISASAAPMLREEALSAQSANIDLVSGATYTSEGYKASLQAALDAAHQ